MASKPSFKDVVRVTTDLSIKRRKKWQELNRLYKLPEPSPAQQRKALKLIADMGRYQLEIDRLTAFYPSKG